MPITTGIPDAQSLGLPVSCHSLPRSTLTREQYSTLRPLYPKPHQYNPSSTPPGDTLPGKRYQRSTSSPLIDSSVSGLGSNYNVLPLYSVETHGTLGYADASSSSIGHRISINLSGTIDKNVFYNDGIWTCYRRNYMSCTCSYSLSPLQPDLPIQFVPKGETQPSTVLGFAVCISAMTADEEPNTAELMLHTAKRDKGPKLKPGKIMLAPQRLPGQSVVSYPESTAPAHLGLCRQVFGALPTQYTYERVNFSSTTRNKGKRQQFFQFVVELWAIIGDQDQVQWAKVATRNSHNLIVRGRSPGYFCQGQIQSTPTNPQPYSRTGLSHDQSPAIFGGWFNSSGTVENLPVHSRRYEAGGEGLPVSFGISASGQNMPDIVKPEHDRVFDAPIDGTPLHEAGFCHYSHNDESAPNNPHFQQACHDNEAPRPGDNSKAIG